MQKKIDCTWIQKHKVKSQHCWLARKCEHQACSVPFPWPRADPHIPSQMIMSHDIPPAHLTHGDNTTHHVSELCKCSSHWQQLWCIPCTIEMLSFRQGVCLGLKCLGTEKKHQENKKENGISVIVVYIRCPSIYVADQLLIHCGYRGKGEEQRNTVMGTDMIQTQRNTKGSQGPTAPCTRG